MRRCSGSRCSGRCCPRASAARRSRSGAGLRLAKSTALMTMPGVQKPHCRPWFSWKASCIGCSAPFAGGRGEALDGGDGRAVGGDRQHRAALHRDAVDVDDAGAALRVSQPTWVPVRPRRLAQQVGQEQRRLARRPSPAPVHCDADVHCRFSASHDVHALPASTVRRASRLLGCQPAMTTSPMAKRVG